MADETRRSRARFGAGADHITVGSGVGAARDAVAGCLGDFGRHRRVSQTRDRRGADWQYSSTSTRPAVVSAARQ